MLESRERPPQEVHIAFGTLFEATTSTTRESGILCVVLGIGEDQWFYSAKCLTAKTGEYSINPIAIGTLGPENIEKLVGTMTVDQVIAAIERGSIEFAGRELDDESRQELIVRSQQGLQSMVL